MTYEPTIVHHHGGFCFSLQATNMSVNRTGELALLAGRKYLTVLNLDAKEKLLVRVPYGGKYEISTTQWSPMDTPCVAIASGQRCDLYALTPDSFLKCQCKLKGHTRMITDVDWCLQQPSILATSSFDNYVHIWDVRALVKKPVLSTELQNENTRLQQQLQLTSDKPYLSLSALDGASQVKWNRWNSDVLATCDGGHVKIWDLRKPEGACEYIAAHASKINGLEWSAKDILVTAAQDCTVKYSRLGNPKSKGPVLSLNAPAWRARPAPFGRGIVTQCVPVLRRDCGVLSLWDWKRFSSNPLYTFQAHDIVEFGWKRGNSSYDLITWSRDQTLRIWTLPREVIELCGGDEDFIMSSFQSPLNTSNEESVTTELTSGKEDTETTDEEAGKNAEQTQPKKKRKSPTRVRRVTTGDMNNPRDENLWSEISQLENSLPECVTYEQMEVERGLLRFHWNAHEKKNVTCIRCSILVSFPLTYPKSTPTFLVTHASPEIDKNSLVKVLKNTSQHFARIEKPSLRPCLDQFALFMKSIKPMEPLDESYSFSSRSVSNVPFPRTSGARFCSVGILVCFGRPSYYKRVKTNCDSGTPRSLSALGPFLSQLALTEETLTLNSRHRRTTSTSSLTGSQNSVNSNHNNNNATNGRRPENKKAGVVTVFDVSSLLPFNRSLAETYKYSVSSLSERKDACTFNASLAEAQHNEETKFIWTAASILAEYFERHEANIAIATNHHRQLANSNSGRVNSHSGYQSTVGYGDCRPHEFGKGIMSNVASSTYIPHYYEDEEEVEDFHWLQFHPLGEELLHDIITHSAKQGDVQTASTLISIFSRQETKKIGNHNGCASNATNSNNGSSKHNRSSSGQRPKASNVSPSPYHTVHGSEDTVTISADTFYRPQRSSSWSESVDDLLLQQQIQMQRHGKNLPGVLKPLHSNVFSSSRMNLNTLQLLAQTAGAIKEKFFSGTYGSRDFLLATAVENNTMAKLSSGPYSTELTPLVKPRSFWIMDKVMAPQNGAAGNRADTEKITRPLFYFFQWRLYDSYKRSYGEVLYRWNLLQQRAEILKRMSQIPEGHNGSIVNLQRECQMCGHSGSGNIDEVGPQCHKCRRLVSTCSICRISVKGLSISCLACGHGGHSSHMVKWFESNSHCPTGCGCSCTTQNAQMFG